MVDDSGSTTATDPNDSNRVAVIQAFLNKYSAKSNLTYSYSYFGSGVFTYDFSTAKFVAQSTNAYGGASGMASALQTFESLGIDGATDYRKAFAQLTTLIENDQPAANDESYVVIFMSDGQPKDLNTPDATASEQLAGIASISDELISAAPAGRITLSTVYFGPPDSEAENNLEAMAAIGDGQFINTNVTTQYSIDNLISVPENACGN